MNIAIKTTADEPPQIRLLLIGPPKSGKTFAAATFPNPLFVDFDNGLTSKELRAKGLLQLPFSDADWLIKTYPQLNNKTRLQPASSFVKFVNSPEVAALTIKDTLVIDSLSTLADAVRKQVEAEKIPTKSGEDNGFAFWRMWADWFRDLCTKLKSLNCHVVLIAHENEIRDSETGRVNAYKFSLPGQEFSPRLPQFFTDIYRQTKEVKPIGAATTDKLQMRVEESYLWQVKKSPQFEAATRMKTDKMYVPATFSSFNY